MIWWFFLTAFWCFLTWCATSSYYISKQTDEDIEAIGASIDRMSKHLREPRV